jgi:hypothetical protein
MVRVASWILIAVIAMCGVAHGADGKKKSGKRAEWGEVQALRVGEPAEVSRVGQAGVDACYVESADDSALICVGKRGGVDARLVFPRGAVQKVWVIELARNLHIGRWIMVGAGIALVVAAGVGSGVVGLAITGLIVCGIEISYFEEFEWRRPPQPPRMRRRLVYSVP